MNQKILRRSYNINGMILLMFGIALAENQSWAFPPQPTPLPTFIYIPVYYYDEDHQAGLVDSFYAGGPPGCQTEIYLSGSETPTYTVPYPFATIRDSNLESHIGEMARFRMTIPTLGIYEGLTRVGEGVTWYVIPTTSEKLGEDLSIGWQPLSSEYQYFTYMNMEIYVLNGLANVGYSMDINSLDNLTNPAEVVVEYLPGCNLERLAIQRGFPVRNGNTLGIRWGGATLPQYPNIWKFGEIAPEGPVKISIHISGYTTDTIVLSADNYRGYEWTALLMAVDGPGPTGFDFSRIGDFTTPTLTSTPTPLPSKSPTPTPIETVLSTTTIIAPTPSLSPLPTSTPIDPKDAVIHQILDLGPPIIPSPDFNGDGIIDVADIIHLIQGQNP